MKTAPIFCYSYTPMQDVAPSAVRIADAIDAINCTINLVVCLALKNVESKTTFFRARQTLTK